MGNSIKFVSAALDETATGEIVLRGVIDPESLRGLLVADYQREVIPGTRANELVRVFEKDGTVADIVLGMRGQKFTTRGEATFLQDDVYIIDGLQRRTAALKALENGYGPRLGATVYFDTNEQWEREQFHVLNKERNKLSPNVLIRNKAASCPMVDMLYKLANDLQFVMHRRVCWTQRRKAGEIISATTYTKVAAMIHSHLGPVQHNDMDRRLDALGGVMNLVGRNVMRDNIKAFFELVDVCYNIRGIQLRGGAIHTRETFLIALAKVLSNHEDFWRDNRLFVEAPLKRKLAGFPTSDPTIISLAGSGGKSRDMLYTLMVDHINSGKRTKRLKARILNYVPLDDDACDETAS